MPIPKQTRMKNFLKQLKWKQIRKRIQQKCLQKWTGFYPKKYHFLIDDYVHRYYLVNPKLKGVRKGDYGNISLSEPYIEK